MSDLNCWVLGQKSHDEIMAILASNKRDRPWTQFFLKDDPYSPGNLNSKCRLEFVPFSQIKQDRFYFVDTSKSPEIFAAGGIMTQISWDYSPRSLPAGWQGVVRQAYFDQLEKNGSLNTQVALLAITAKRFRGRGLAGMVLSKMCSITKSRGFRYLLVPALPPTQHEKEYAHLSAEEILAAKREDGSALDYWVRLHTKKGAIPIGVDNRSHRFAYSLQDFHHHISSDYITFTGEHLIRLDKAIGLGPDAKNMWQIVYADVDREFVVFDWKCIWILYDVRKLDIE